MKIELLLSFAVLLSANISMAYNYNYQEQLQPNEENITADMATPSGVNL
jgi:hypothetical protein